ncbi:LacI family DNA-binding transcriptional regulator [Actinosynnema pretiosum]|uniref:LacI family transcriptional regulator n=1 Tax=Actinosynnema pretiosum TaxID=42197 RepID=A0A290Z6T7_9PSEU|nr:LacI family DNA-binding transcriptional regulator [Actinosynnema pretiosum]ATE54695.1 LacI family transcriptional regulator [Actinosynnema pretiosum]
MTGTPPRAGVRRGGRTRVTLADVASACAVSVPTASLVLSGRARELRISAAVERRVRATAEQLGYRRDTLLSASRTKTLGFVSDAVASAKLSGELIEGAVDAAHRHGFTLFAGESGGDREVEAALVASLRARQVEGVVFAARFPRLLEVPDGLRDGPSVLLNVLPANDFPAHAVLPDDRGGGRSAARVLLDAGHREGVHLIGTGPTVEAIAPRHIAAVARLSGALEVFAAAGVEVESVRPCLEWMPENGYRATLDLLSRHRPRALLCFNDRLAFGACQALAEAGLSVPGDVSVVGFDDHPVAAWMRPRLTTVALPHHRLGATAVELLLSRPRRDRSPTTVHHVPMPVVAGGSVRAVEHA